MTDQLHPHEPSKFSHSQIKVEVVSSDSKETEFAKHIDECNTDFKENVMKKVVTLKLKDTDELNNKVLPLPLSPID